MATPGFFLSETGKPVSGSSPEGISMPIILVSFFNLYEFTASNKGLYLDATGRFIPTPNIASIRTSYLSISVIRLSISDSISAILS